MHTVLALAKFGTDQFDGLRLFALTHPILLIRCYDISTEAIAASEANLSDRVR